MNDNANPRVSDKPPNYNLWVGVFCVFVVIAAGLFYYATQRIEYKIPQPNDPHFSATHC